MTKYRIVTTTLTDSQVSSFERLRKLTKHGAHTADLTVTKDAVDHHFEADWIYTAKIEPVDA